MNAAVREAAEVIAGIREHGACTPVVLAYRLEQAGLLKEPASTCAECRVPVPAGQTWCSWRCRNLDDQHDAFDYLDGEE